MKRVGIIFGASGQDGYYLKQLLLTIGVDVIGVSRSGDAVHANVADHAAVEQLIKQHQPMYVFHFAAVSSIRHEFLFDNHAAICTGTLNILESVRKHSKETKVFISGSALQFVNKGLPISESCAFEGRDPYSVARIYSVFAARYFRSLGLQVYVGYFFHHDSPRRPEGHLNMRIAQCAKRISQGAKEILEVGNIAVVKEFNFAGDLMGAVWKLVNQTDIFEATLGSGRGYKIERWIDECFSAVGLNWREHIRQPASFIADFDQLVCDPTSIFSLGWSPKVEIGELASMMVNNRR